MNTLSLNAPTVQRHRVLRWAAVIGGTTVAFTTGLLTANLSPSQRNVHTRLSAPS